MLHDEHVRACTQDLRRLAQNQLDQARVLPGHGRQRIRTRGGSDLVEPHQPALSLGNDLLRDDDNISRRPLDICAGGGGENFGRDIRARCDPWDPVQPDHGGLTHRGTRRI